MSLCKLYQLGRKFFCCNGRVVLGNKNQKLSVSLCVLALLPIIFLILELCNGPRSRFFLLEENEIILPIIVVLWVLSIVTFGRCAFADPGILKKQVLLEVDLQNKDCGSLLCEKCNVERPNERTHHCKVCDVCVEEMDHHCGWMGACIGKRTRRRFMIAVMILTLFQLFMVAICFSRFSSEQMQKLPPKTIYRRLYLAAFGLVYFLGGCFTLILALFHVYLVMTQQTTIEFLLGKYRHERNPFDKGCFQNCFEFFSRPSFAVNIDLDYLQKSEEMTDVSRL